MIKMLIGAVITLNMLGASAAMAGIFDDLPEQQCAMYCPWGFQLGEDCKCAEEPDLPWNQWPIIPGPEQPSPKPPLGACGLYCQWGSGDEWCTCAPAPWEQFDGEDWRQPLIPGREYRGAGGRINLAENRDLQKKLTSILLGYCDAYPEFAAAVLPMLKDAKAAVTADKGFAYIMNGGKALRIAGSGKYLEKPADQKGAAGFRAAASQAADAVIEEAAAWK